MMAAEAPRPGVGTGRAEDAQVVAGRDPAPLVAKRRAPGLELVEDVLEAHDSRGRHVAGPAQSRRQQAHGEPLLRRAHLTQRETAVVGRRVEPAEALLVRREVPLRLAPLVRPRASRAAPGRPRPCARPRPRPSLTRPAAQAEDQLRIARHPGAVELRPAADAAGALEELCAQGDLPRLPPREGRRNVTRHARSPSASAQASAAAFAVPAAACGRTTNAASPIRQTRPKAMRGTSMS